MSSKPTSPTRQGMVFTLLIMAVTLLTLFWARDVLDDNIQHLRSLNIHNPMKM